MEKKLTRTPDKLIAGVCGGLANYLGLDPTLMRVGYALLTCLLAGFPGLLLYIILWFVMPMEDK